MENCQSGVGVYPLRRSHTWSPKRRRKERRKEEPLREDCSHGGLLHDVSACAAVLPRRLMSQEMRTPLALETKCARSDREIEGMSRLERLVSDVSRRVIGCSQVNPGRRKVDFGSLVFHEFVMEEEMAERTVIKKIGPRKGPVVPVTRTLEEHVFAAVFNEARALRDASDLADECGYGGSR